MNSYPAMNISDVVRIDDVGSVTGRRPSLTSLLTNLDKYTNNKDTYIHSYDDELAKWIKVVMTLMSVKQSSLHSEL